MPDQNFPPAVPPPSPPVEPGDIEDALFVEPPRWPKVVGIISIVWAALGLTCTGLLILSILVFFPMMQAGAAQASPGMTLPPTMRMDAIKWANMVLSIFVIVLLLIAGVMLVNRRPAARTLHLVYGAVALALACFGLYLQWQGLQQMAQWRQTNPTSPFAKSNPTGDMVGLAFGAVFGLAWPVFCLIWFGLVKRTPDSMTGGIDEPAA